MWKRYRITAAAAGLVSLASYQAGAAVLTFESLNGTSTSLVGTGSETFALDGFKFTFSTGGRGGGWVITKCDSPCLNNGTAAYYQNNNGLLTMQREDGSAFSLISLDAVNPAAGQSAASLQLSVGGTTLGGGSVGTYIYAPDTATFFSTYALTGFSDLLSVSFSGATSLRSYFALDNIIYTASAPVPLPAAAWLLLSSLGGLAAVARTRKAATPA